MEAGRWFDALLACHIGSKTGRGGVVANCGAVTGHQDHLAFEARRNVAFLGSRARHDLTGLVRVPGRKFVARFERQEERICAGGRCFAISAAAARARPDR